MWRCKRNHRSHDKCHVTAAPVHPRTVATRISAERGPIPTEIPARACPHGQPVMAGPCLVPPKRAPAHRAPLNEQPAHSYVHVYCLLCNPLVATPVHTHLEARSLELDHETWAATTSYTGLAGAEAPPIRYGLQVGTMELNDGQWLRNNSLPRGHGRRFGSPPRNKQGTRCIYSLGVLCPLATFL